MKKTLLVIALLLMAGKLWAGNCELPNFQWDGKKLTGDIVLDFSEDGELGVGTGLKLATLWQGIGELRAEWVVFDQSEKNKVGAGIGVSIPKLLEKLGADWVQKGIDVSVGVIALLDLKEEPELGVGLYLTILKIQW